LTDDADRRQRGVPVLPEIRGRRWALHHRTYSANQLVNAHSELVDAAIGLDTALSQRNHRLIKAFYVVCQLIDTPLERTHTPCERTHTPRKRTHDGFKPGEALIVLHLIVQEEFDGFLDIHLFHVTIVRGPERQGPSRSASR